MLMMRPERVWQSAVVLKPLAILAFYRALIKHKYRLLFTPIGRSKPGPKGPWSELINATVATKQRNSRWGCPRIAAQICLAFGVAIDKDIVYRVLARHYRPAPRDYGPSWLTFLGHMKDSLWSVDLFRCESATLRSHWVLLVMDQYTRRIIGFAVHAGAVDGTVLCRIFTRAIRGQSTPRFLSFDHDPLFTFGRWRANLRIMNITEIKTVPHVPLSHPFVEHLIGTIRREYLDQMLFWGRPDLERTRLEFRYYYNHHRAYASLKGATPAISAEHDESRIVDLDHYRWKSHCRGLYQTPMAA